MRLEPVLDQIHAAVRRSPWLQRFTALTRLLLVVGFVPPGLTKVLGLPFTSLGPDTQVGAFFDALHQTGTYYQFIGWAQVVAGLLLLFPRTATLGALIYFPIILNIAVLTMALPFQGTPLITWPMLLAALYLICWDYNRLKPLLWPRSHSPAEHRFDRREYLWQALGLCVAGCAGFTVLTYARFGSLHQLGAPGLLVVACAGTCFGLGVAWHLRAQ